MVGSKTTKGEITNLAKRICKLNVVLSYACMDAEALVNDKTLRNLMQNRESSEWRQLKEKVAKYRDDSLAVDVIGCEVLLDEAGKIISALFEGDEG